MARRGIDYDRQALQAAIRRQGDDIKTRITRATAKATRASQLDIRDGTRGALGPRVANAWRATVYPQNGASDSPAGEVRSAAPMIIKTFSEGATIRGRSGQWLAIPFPAAGQPPKGKRMTPLLFEQTRGLPLRFVYLPGRRKALLVADNARLSGHGRKTVLPAPKNDKGRGIGRAQPARRGGMTLPIFLLVPQVTIGKRLDLPSLYATATRHLAAELARELTG